MNKWFMRSGLAALLLLLLALLWNSTGGVSAETPAGALAKPANPKHKIATFAGGCFWCMEPPFDKIKGVISTTSGYTDGKVHNPTYQAVSRGRTGHTEAVRIVYDPNLVSYDKLLQVFWRQINPTTQDRQFVDKGSQYRTGIYYHSETQKRLAIKSKQALEKSGRFDKPIVTEIKAATAFWPAEDYHQDYYKKSPRKYKFYRWNSGRDQYLDRIWGKDREIK